MMLTRLTKQPMDSNNPTVAKRKASLERELNELRDICYLVEGELFQKYFATPLYQEEKKLKSAYECNTLADLRHIQGKHEGIQFFFKQVDEIKTRMKFILDDLEKLN